MKSNKQIFILLIAVLIFSSNLLGQRKPISEKEYEALREAAQAKVDKKIRRETTVENDYKDGKVTRTSTIVQEYLPPDKEKWLVTESNRSRIINKTELIYLGDFEFRKENGGSWVKRNVKGDGDDGEGFGLTAIVEKGTREYFLEETTVDRETHKVLHSVRTNAQKTETNEYKIWINKEGLIYKTTSEINLKPEAMVLYSTATFEYNISKPIIEAPIK